MSDLRGLFRTFTDMENFQKASRRVNRTGFDLNDWVRLINCKEGDIYMVTGITIRNAGSVLYAITFAGEELHVSEFEIEKATP